MFLLLILQSCLPSSECEPLCWRYRNTDMTFLDVNLQHSSAGDEVITLTGVYDHERHTATNKSTGFYLSRNRSVMSSEDVDIKIFIKDVVPEGGLVRVPTIIRYCCNPKSKTGVHNKIVFEDSMYSRDSYVIYQLLFTETSLTLRINNETIVINKPPSTDPDYWHIGNIRQRGEATRFIEVSVCPLKITTTIMKGIVDAELCLQGDECEATTQIVELMGSLIRMSCFASGIPPIELWWSFNETNLTNGSRGYRIITNKSEYTTEIAFILKEGTGGQYTCHAVNRFNSSIHSFSNIEVFGYLPLSSYIIQRRLDDVTCAQGDESCVTTELVEFIGREVNMSCVASGTLPIQLWWSLGSTNLTNGADYGIKVVNNATEITFTLEEATEGWYTCHAVYTFNTSIRSSAVIGVSGYLPLTTHILEPKYVVTQVGASVKFTCMAYQWPLGSDRVFWSHLDRNTNTNPLSTKLARDRDENGRSREVHTLEMLNVGYRDSGVFRCGNDMASLYVERAVETPDVQFNRTKTGEIEVSCSTYADPPPASLDLHVRLDEYEKMWDVELQNKSSKRAGSFSMVTWILEPSQEYLRVFFSCKAVQRERKVETSGHAVFSKSLEVATFYTSQHNDTNLHYGDNFSLECSAIGNPAPDYIALVRDADQVVEEFKNEHVTRYHVKLKRSFQNITGREHGSYRCVANDTFRHSASFLRSAPLEIRVYQELTTVEFKVEPGFGVLNGTLSVEEKSQVKVKCSAIGGFPKPGLLILYNDAIVDAHSEYINDTAVATEADVVVTETSEVKCEAWQDMFGAEVMSQSITLVVVVPTTAPSWQWLMSLDYKVIVFWGRRCASAIIGITILVTIVYLVYACCCRRRASEEEFEPLSVSEEELLRTRSIEHANRRLELLSHLSEHPVSDPNIRIIKSLSRSRGSLESMRSRQRLRTQSGDIVQDSSDRDSHTSL